MTENVCELGLCWYYMSSRVSGWTSTSVGRLMLQWKGRYTGWRLEGTGRRSNNLHQMIQVTDRMRCQTEVWPRAVKVGPALSEAMIRALHFMQCRRRSSRVSNGRPENQRGRWFSSSLRACCRPTAARVRPCRSICELCASSAKSIPKRKADNPLGRRSARKRSSSWRNDMSNLLLRQSADCRFDESPR